jgi:hypothetical protein
VRRYKIRGAGVHGIVATSARSTVLSLRLRRSLGALAVLALAAACGNQDNVSSHATPASAPPATANAGPNRELLFAVLEPGGDLTSMRDTAVAIVRVDGTAKAKARLDARQLPRVGNALPLPQPEARVAAGRVFYADGAGAVRSLAPDGAVVSVASFPLANPQQLLSFAVSPDGTQLLGTIFSFPPVHNPPPQTPIDPPFGPGDFAQQLWSARPGQALAPPLVKRNWPQSGGPPKDALALVGWSRDAPLATIDTMLGTQQGSLGRRTFGHVAELDTAGRPGPPLGGYNCDTWSVLADETVLCDDDGQLRNFSVRSRDGTVRFKLRATGEQQFLDLSLAPDAAHVAYLVTGGRPMVSDAAGKTLALPATFKPMGWLNAGTMVGTVQTQQGDGDMALVRLDRPARMDDLGFHGYFVGVVQGG